MSIGDWFKKKFGKQVCAFCGQEVGMLKRDKIKNDEYICYDCKHNCSPYIQVYRYTKDQLLGHMEYMKHQGKLVESISALKGYRLPSASKQGIIFYDEVGMFRVYNSDKDSKYPKELFRYDQVAKYELYRIETEPAEKGKEKEFKEGGVKITLLGDQPNLVQVPNGRRVHPYVSGEITIRLDEKDVTRYAENIIRHFDSIFGVNDNTKGLFQIGPTKQQKREGEALKAMGSMFGAAIKAAKDGEIPEDAAAKVTDAMNKVDDAATSGLAKYSRLADEAENKIKM